MGAHRNQIGDLKWAWGHGKRNSGRWVKKQMNKYWRRLNKQDPENAPTKRPIKGYD